MFFVWHFTTLAVQHLTKKKTNKQKKRLELDREEIVCERKRDIGREESNLK